MKKILAVLMFVPLLVFGGQTVLTGNGTSATAVAVNTYTTSQVDTVVLRRWSSGISGLSFALHVADSTSITNVIVRRVINGLAQAVIAGDTLFSTFTNTSSTLSASKTATVTMTPLCEVYWFVVTYAGSGQGVTTPTVTYIAETQFAK